MNGDGYSTIVDAILFLAMVSACALILSPAIAGGGRERAAADAGLRATASSCLASLSGGRVDYFEYRILGDRADEVAAQCGIDPGSWLYRDVTEAVLGRSCRHKPALEVTAEAAACQFTVRTGSRSITLNPLTAEYRSAVEGVIEEQMAERLDERYAYNFSLRWVPFAGVPFEGAVDCGKPCPSGAASASTMVTMPFRTSISNSCIEEAIAPELGDIEALTLEYRRGVQGAAYRDRLREKLGSCLENSSRLMAGEVLGNTVYRVLPANDPGNPLGVLASFADDYSVSAGPVLLDTGTDLDSLVAGMVVQYNQESLDSLADKIVEGVNDGTIGPGEERSVIVGWLGTRYNPSMARATLSVWVREDAA